MKNYLLDTHIWYQFVTGDEALKPTARKLISESIPQHGVCVAAISCWEIAMLNAKKRIILKEPSFTWIKHSLYRMRSQVLELSIEVATESCQLPDDFHADPADRLIVATARVHGIPLITQDKNILRYAKNGYLNVIKG